MKKTWLIFRNEYLHHVLRRRFIFALLSMPLFVLLMVGVGLLAVWADYDGRPVGYLDQSGFFVNARPLPPKSDALFQPVRTLAYSSVAAMQADLSSGRIQAYFVIDSSYLQDGRVTAVAQTSVKDMTRQNFQDFLRYNLLAGQPAQISARVLDGPMVEVESADGSRKMAGNELVTILMPLVSGLLFIVVINMSGSYLVQALVEEKENRTMEIVITSVSSQQLMTGKVAGNLAVGLTELVCWLGFGVLGFVAAQRYFPGAEKMQVSPDFIALMLATLLPAFVMVAAMMAAVGSASSNSREAQQWAGLFTLPIVVPFWLFVPLMQSPNSPLAVGMSLFPLTAPITLPLRVSFTQVPAWQIAASLAILVACAAGSLWLAGRTFRLGMLSYGQRLPWRAVFRRGA